MLQHLIDVYFRDFDAYFPFLHRQGFEARVYSAIQRLGYSACNIVVMADIDDLAIIALLCIMLALAECVDPGEGARDGDRKPGWKRYLFCRRAIHHLSRSKPQRPLELDVVRAQCLVAAYLMQCEALPEASQAVTVVWQLATSIRLHNQKVWPKEEPTMALQRQQLWWTIYFLDRQVSRKSGIAYHIRDREFDVDDFTNNGIDSAHGSSIATSIQPSVVAKGYMQGLIDQARLWGNVWDTFFAVGATKKEDRMEIEIMDARILYTRRQLPGFLTWDSNELAKYLLMGEDESHIRRRLQLYTVSVEWKAWCSCNSCSNSFAETGASSHADQTKSRTPSSLRSRNGSSLLAIGAPYYRSSWPLHIAMSQRQSDRVLHYKLDSGVHISPGLGFAPLKGRTRARCLCFSFPPGTQHPFQALVIQPGSA